MHIDNGLHIGIGSRADELSAMALGDTIQVPPSPWEWQPDRGRPDPPPTRFDPIGALMCKRLYKPTKLDSNRQSALLYCPKRWAD